MERIKKLESYITRKVKELEERNKVIREGIPNMTVSLNTISSFQYLKKEYDDNVNKIDTYKNVLCEIELIDN